MMCACVRGWVGAYLSAGSAGSGSCPTIDPPKSCVWRPKSTLSVLAEIDVLRLRRTYIHNHSVRGAKAPRIEASGSDRLVDRVDGPWSSQPRPTPIDSDTIRRIFETHWQPPHSLESLRPHAWTANRPAAAPKAAHGRNVFAPKTWAIYIQGVPPRFVACAGVA